ncbi:malignant T-cell-amplified sequence 1 isoform X3 [Muntiacus reevesi]|uniref:malignant T-cell-amplified sequence 1 isoform X3 n=1 Tax=Muntiacus reevesi TaxID=9886 RepID=UPI003306EC09
MSLNTVKCSWLSPFPDKDSSSDCQCRPSSCKGICRTLANCFSSPFRALPYRRPLHLGSCSRNPFILPHQQVDKGAIKFVLSGANIMCPGLTSPGAKLYPAAVDTIVAIMAEGKQHALCVGVMKMSAEDIEKVNKGIGIENIHYLNDGLWHMKTYK